VQPKSPNIVFVTLPSAGVQPAVHKVALAAVVAPQPQAILAPRTIEAAAEIVVDPPESGQAQQEP
jgi:hypothetical protein